MSQVYVDCKVKVKAFGVQYVRWMTLSGLLLVLLGLLVLPWGGPPAHAQYQVKPSDQPPLVSDMSLLTLELEAVTLQELIAGRKSLLFYFSPTCGHCRDAAPVVRKLHEKYGAKLPFIGIAPSRVALKDVRAFQEEFGLSFRFASDSSGMFAQKNKVQGTPTFFLSDGSATPTERYALSGPELEIVLEVGMTRYLGGNPLSLLTPDRYHGSLVCGSCHREESTSWSLNHHAVAMSSLFKIQKHEDPACVGCHVTGFQQPTGYKNLLETSHLAHVGCESCHGMAGGHNLPLSVEEKLKQKALPADQKYAKVCVSCHDAKHTIAFDVKKGIPLVGHHHDRTLTQVAWLEKRAKLLKDELDKPLLAFPEGKVQGDAACKSCHAQQHARLQNDPHVKAPQALAKGGSCESCHGPGEAHIKAGGTKNTIVGLTESCPVCVIDSICSSCHTRELSPQFELDKALQVVRQAHRGP